MTEQEILDGNRLIAEFMGYELKDITSLNSKYHSSWEWLMPVVEKIKKNYHIKMNIGDNKGIIYAHYGYKEIAAKVDSKYNPIIPKTPTAQNPLLVCEFKSPLEACFNLMVRFINWYNERK